MIITEKTKISDLIKANPATIDAIAEINKHFKKLKNPILRRTLAKRVTIRDAAKIGGVSVGVFFDKLANIGFEIEQESGAPAIEKENKNMEFKIEDDKLVALDVRPNIEAGNDPFQVIMAAMKELPESSILKIINSFEPIPLINVLKGKGYLSQVERPEEGVVYTYFKKGEKVEKMEEVEANPSDTHDFESMVKSYEGRLKTIDVRHLEMPEPMVTILSELEVLPTDHALFVHHKKMPKFLLPELQTRGYQYVEKRMNDHTIDFLFYKA